MVHSITYELIGIRLPDETARLEDAIKSLGECYSIMKHGWLVESELSNQEICEKLAGCLRPKDRMLVTRIHKDWYAANVPQEEADWLSARNFAGVGDPPLFRR